ncbi:MAG: glycosyltransferase family 4 protein [Candidatus Methanofastidiosa archaeon]|nr:glycosyltransferase family 4 protein [Candidatus Methanofastidiosa archaeon]
MILTGSSSSSCKSRGSIYSSTIEAIERINYLVSDSLIVYSPRLIEKWDLQDYANKILIAHEHFLDFKVFAVTTPFPDRPSLIGYIGRLSGEKGVQHFAQALPAILVHQQDLRALIGGDGQLKESIASSLQQDGIAERVDLPGWLSHDELPKHLNQLRLLVLPSYTEGLPNIMLEAMACGTPVLATPVGAVPDVIVDGKTGFIMENNSPECIAENVMRALEHPDLEGVAQRARALVEREYTFERAVERWKSILEEVSNDAK